MCGQRKISGHKKSVVKQSATKDVLKKKPAVKEKICGQRKSVVKSALFGATQNVVKQRKRMWSKLGATSKRVVKENH